MGLYKCSLNENQPTHKKGDKTKETLYLYIDDIMIDERRKSQTMIHHFQTPFSTASNLVL